MAIIDGTDGNDVVTGGIENDTINALAGADFIYDAAGNDVIDRRCARIQSAHSPVSA